MQTIAYDLTKSSIIDASLTKYKPSVTAVSLVALGFQLQFELLIDARKIDLSTPSGRQFCQNVCLSYRCFRNNVCDDQL